MGHSAIDAQSCKVTQNQFDETPHNNSSVMNFKDLDNMDFKSLSKKIDAYSNSKQFRKIDKKLFKDAKG